MLEYQVRYRIRHSMHPMSFTAERKLPLPRRHHAGAEESQRHETWIPAPSFCAIPQLDPQRFDEERSFHSARECYGPFRISSHWQHRFSGKVDLKDSNTSIDFCCRSSNWTAVIPNFLDCICHSNIDTCASTMLSIGPSMRGLPVHVRTIYH